MHEVMSPKLGQVPMTVSFSIHVESAPTLVPLTRRRRGASVYVITTEYIIVITSKTLLLKSSN